MAPRKKRGTPAERSAAAKALREMSRYNRMAVQAAKSGDCSTARGALINASLAAHRLSYGFTLKAQRPMTKAHGQVQRYCPRQTTYRR